ncbi:MAG: ROK family protein, partial [Halanaerobiaceae bacterium]
MQKGSFEMMKKRNQQVILRVIYDEKTISRAKIAEITGLSPATVTNNVRELMKMELLQETSRGESRGGRKPVLLELNPDGAYFIGFEWGISEVSAVLLDLNKNVIKAEEIPVEDVKIDWFVNTTDRVTTNFKEIINDTDKLYGVGIGIHGLVDPFEGVSLFAPHFHWCNLHVEDILIEHLCFPVMIDNDVRTMAQAEKWNDKDNFVFVNTGSGIGAAVVLDGKVQLGRDYSAGEFGHMTIVEDGPRCSCGNYGCLEALISTEHIVEEYSKGTDWRTLVGDAKMGNKKANNILNIT